MIAPDPPPREDRFLKLVILLVGIIALLISVSIAITISDPSWDEAFVGLLTISVWVCIMTAIATVIAVCYSIPLVVKRYCFEFSS